MNFITGYGTATQQMAGELFQQLSGTKLTFVPYKTNTAMLMAVVSGEIDIAVSDPAGLAAFMKGEQVSVLATTALQRMPVDSDIVRWKQLTQDAGVVAK